MNDLDKIKVIGLGQACYDCLGRIPCFPDEDSKIEITDLHTQCGGPVASALTVLSRLGISTSFIGSISDDYFGTEILENFKDEFIDTTFLKVTPGFTSQFAFISINKKTLIPIGTRAKIVAPAVPPAFLSAHSPTDTQPGTIYCKA